MGPLIHDPMIRHAKAGESISTTLEADRPFYAYALRGRHSREAVEGSDGFPSHRSLPKRLGVAGREDTQTRIP